MASDDDMVEGELVTVTMTVRCPKAGKREDFDEWLRFELTRSGGMKIANPYCDQEVKIWGNCSFDWDSTGHVGYEQHSNHWKKADGSSGYTIHYIQRKIGELAP